MHEFFLPRATRKPARHDRRTGGQRGNRRVTGLWPTQCALRRHSTSPNPYDEQRLASSTARERSGTYPAE
jgi:hypothetical protein